MIDRSLFHVEDFLADNTFQLYCSGKDQLCISYWEQYILSHPEQYAAITEAKRLYFILSAHKKPMNAQLERFRQMMNEQEEPEIALSIKRRFPWWQTAAAIFLLMGISFFFFQPGKELPSQQKVVTHFSTKSGERKKITLSDGTIVLLNAKSKLTLLPCFNGQSREVSLLGEAFFDVVHDQHKPFRVHTDDFDINVLGTAFNVKAYPEEPTSEATLIRGRIVMEGKGSKAGPITLLPSQKVTFYKIEEPKLSAAKAKKATLHKPEISINHFTRLNDSVIAEVAWTQNRLEITDQSFADVKGKLERWFNVELIFKDKEVEKYRFTASFFNENIEQALKAMKDAEHFKYEIKGNKITISK